MVTHGSATSGHWSSATAVRAVRHLTRGRAAANGTEDPPAFSPVRFRECGRLSRRAASGFPGLRLLSPAIGLGPDQWGFELDCCYLRAACICVVDCNQFSGTAIFAPVRLCHL